MVDHPCKGMTRAQREAFEAIAVNQVPQCKWPTIDALLKAGVIARGKGEIRRDAMGTYEIPYFFVPLPIHAQWCEWCSEQVGVTQHSNVSDIGWEQAREAHHSSEVARPTLGTPPLNIHKRQGES